MKRKKRGKNRGRVAFLGSRTKRDRGKKSILCNGCSGGEGLPEEDEDARCKMGRRREGLSARRHHGNAREILAMIDHWGTTDCQERSGSRGDRAMSIGANN